MKFLLDAQLPKKLLVLFTSKGIEAIHTLDLPSGNRTSDQMINAISMNQHYIVVTKDSDFVDSFHLQRKPWKLLLISGAIQERGA